MNNLISFTGPDFQNLLSRNVPNLNQMASHTTNTIKIKTNYYWKYFLYLLATYFLISTIVTIIITVILIRAKNKVQHQFWYNQPVYIKSYGNSLYLFSAFYGNCIIKEDLPKIDNWTNYQNIEFLPILDINAEDITTITTFIRENYKDSEFDAYKYTLNEVNFYSYLVSHNSTSYLACYYNTNKDILGTITAYPLNISIHKNGKQINLHKDENYENIVYYVDNLCVDYDSRNQKIAPQLIRTLYHKIRHTNYTTKVALFKRENFDNFFIEPLTTYQSNIYKIENWFNQSFDINPQCKVLEISEQNLHLLYNFIYNNHNKFFDICIYPDMTNMLELLKQNCIHIQMIMKGDMICSVYFFKNNNTVYGDKKTVECIGTINNNQSMNFLTQGFYHILEKISKKYDYKMLQLEEISHNKKLNEYVIRLNTPIIITTQTWFLYNYKFEYINSEKVFILN